MEEKHDLDLLFNQFVKKMNQWLPEGVIDVDLGLLHKHQLLQFHERIGSDPTLTRYFHVIDSEEKLVLVNSEFVVWIVPENSVPAKTFTLIALNKSSGVQPELAFEAKGIYNNSYLVLRLLEKFLLEIHITEDLISKLETRLTT